MKHDLGAADSPRNEGRHANVRTTEGEYLMSDPKRRDFFKVSLASLATAAGGRSVLAEQRPSEAGIPTRPLGRAGERVSIIGLGGYDIGVPEEKLGIAIVHEAIDEGVTFFDSAWDYHQGGSEQVLGKALATGGRRDKVFLMTKNCARDYKGSRQHLEDSLRRLKTDRVDLWQFHEIDWHVDPDWIFDRGALKYAIEARKAGKVRHIGFTGHRSVANQLKMILRPFEWDTAQMPINILDAHYRSFQKNVLPECLRRKISVIGMKALGGGGGIPRGLKMPAEVCRRYSLSLPISTLVCGIRSRKDLLQDVAMARSFKPMSEEELQALRDKTKAVGNDGKLEGYKRKEFGSRFHFRQHEESPGR